MLLNRQLLKNDADYKKTILSTSNQKWLEDFQTLDYKRIIKFWHKDLYCTLAFTQVTVTLLTPPPRPPLIHHKSFLWFVYEWIMICMHKIIIYTVHA